MRRSRVLTVQKKPKSWSVGCFVAAATWVFGDVFLGLGYNLPWLIAICIFSFVVDLAFTGHTSRKDVYID